MGRKRWVDKRCCDWDTFLDSLLASAHRLKFPVILINRCEARHAWRRYGCTGHEVVLMQRARELQDALYSGYGEPPISGGDDGGGKDPDAPSRPNSPRPPNRLKDRFTLLARKDIQRVGDVKIGGPELAQRSI